MDNKELIKTKKYKTMTKPHDLQFLEKKAHPKND